ncbi:MAG TPA: Uma2 family endonuclease [Kofleriaceae bacterium]|nr:Uma2 family endonuclease [Kofleriaceae bacterium]
MPLPAPELVDEHIRPLKRVEYERLASEGFFDDERVELLFGAVVEMTPIDRAHVLSAYRVRETLARRLEGRALVLEGSPFAASDISEPEPDILVTAPSDDWTEHPTHAWLVVEVARSSLRKDRGVKARLYGLSEVDEYWIVNHEDGVVEVYRDRVEGAWRTKTVHGRGETIAMLRCPDVLVHVGEILPPPE